MAIETAQNDKIGQVCKRWIDAGKKARKRFMDQGREIMRYGFSPEFNFEYQNLAPNAFFKAKVGKTSEAIQLFVPMLWQESPKRLLTSRPWVPPWKASRRQVRSDYLNYILSENGHAAHSKRALVESICYGMGVRWTGRHPESGLIYSPYDSVRNLLVDPNATSWDEVQGVARRRSMPKWLAKNYIKVPGASEIIDALPASSRRESDVDSRFEWEKADTSVECITFYEIWFKVGIHNFQGGSDLAVQDDMGVDDSPKKYFIHETGKFIGVDNWEIPFYLRNMWPCEVVGYYGAPDSIWNTSPLEPGIGYQRAMNWIVTMLMGKYRFTSKTMFAIKKQNGQGLADADLDKLLIGNDIDAIQIDIKGEKKSIRDFVEQFDYSQEYIAAGLTFLEAINNKYEMATGMYGIFYSGEGNAQSRSARDADMKDRNSHTRIDDMRAEVTNWEKRICKKEDFAAGFLLKREDLAPILGDQAAQAWGYLVPNGQSDPAAVAQEILQQVPGANPQAVQQMAMQEAAQRYTLLDISLDTDYDVESASQKKRDINTRLDALKEMANTVMPVQLQSMDPAEKSVAYLTLSEYGKDIGLSEETIEAYKGLAQRYLQISQMGVPPPGAEPPPAKGAKSAPK